MFRVPGTTLRLVAAATAKPTMTTTTTCRPIQSTFLHISGNKQNILHHPYPVISNDRIGFPRYASSSAKKSRILSDDDEKWYDSYEVNKDARDDSSLAIGKANNQKSFKDVPVHPSILAYIEALGVGIHPRRDPRSRSRQKKSRNRFARRGGGDVLDDAAERVFFNKQSAGGRRQTASRSTKPNTGKSDDENEIRDTSSWLPPMPFSAGTSKGVQRTFNECHKVKRLPVKVLGGAATIHDEFPRSTKRLTEVALAGRSNVGKSTLLNALLFGNQPGSDGKPIKSRLGRRLNPERTKMPRGAKAVVSAKPGETREITLYQLSSEIISTKDEGETRTKKSKMSLVLSDLPGYGFSFASEGKARAWRELMQHYLLHRGRSLKRVLLLIDARHGMKPADFEFLDTLQDALKANADAAKMEKGGRKVKDTLPPIQIILTKCDLVKQKDLARRVVLVRQQLSDSLRREPSSLPVMLVSAKPGVGYNNVRHHVAKGGVLELQRELAALVPNPTDNTTH